MEGNTTIENKGVQRGKRPSLMIFDEYTGDYFKNDLNIIIDEIERLESIEYQEV